MTNIPKKDLNHLKQTTKKLNAAADKATQKLNEVSEWLDENGPGISVFLDGHPQAVREVRSGSAIHKETFGKEGYDYYLGYGRVGNGWGLVIKREYWKTEEEEFDGEKSFHEEVAGVELFSIESTSRIIRIKAVQYLEQLIEKITIVADNLAEEMEEQ